MLNTISLAKLSFLMLIQLIHVLYSQSMHPLLSVDWCLKIQVEMSLFVFQGFNMWCFGIFIDWKSLSYKILYGEKEWSLCFRL